ncbi:hypothetical protein HAX54_033652 [Datura stramonium]|uniref:Uncharacterized protein n=1 Tax=Datura stramonium TaxID=4076 RepID=A0ABS8VFP1_DATST|nr:hypothetical protein [Datura stramonium]
MRVETHETPIKCSPQSSDWARTMVTYAWNCEMLITTGGRKSSANKGWGIDVELRSPMCLRSALAKHRLRPKFGFKASGHYPVPTFHLRVVSQDRTNTGVAQVERHSAQVCSSDHRPPPVFCNCSAGTPAHEFDVSTCCHTILRFLFIS